RMGTDTVNNFYEYRVNVSEGWAESNRMEIDFTELTALKNYMILNNDGQTNGVDTTDGKYYIRGNPSLTRILWYVVGIEVSDSASGSLSGEVWVNELRVTEPRNNNDWAGRLALSTKFADFIDISASYQRQGADFHNLLQKKGSGSITTSKNLRGSLSFHKFLPPGWGLSIPVSASWSNTLSLPRLKPGSDIILPQELRDTEKSDNTTTTFNVSESMRMKTDSWLVNATLNRLSGSLSTSKNESRTPSVPQSSTGRWNLKSKYDLSMRSKPKVSIFGWTEKIYILKTLSKSDFYLLPTTLTFNGEVNSQKRNSLSISGTRTDVYNRDLSLKSNAAYSPFTAINSSFSFTSLRDIRDGPAFNLSLNPDELKLGTELDYNQRFDSSWRPKLISFLETRFSYTANYHHNSDPKQQRDSTYSIDNGNAVNLETSLTWQKLLGGGKKYGAQKSGGRKFPGQGGKDKEIEEDEEEEEDRGPMPGSPVWLWEKFIGVFRSLDPLRLNFSRSKSLAKSGLLGEPSFGYKFGFYEDPGVETIVVENLGQRDQKSLTDSYTLKSGIAPFKSLSADFSYTRRVSTTRSTTEPTRSNSVTFPDISISLTQLERVGFIKKIASSSSLQSGYSIKKDTKDNPDTGELTRTETKKSFNPLFSWSLNWKNGVRTSLKYDKSNTNSEDLRGSGATNTLKRSGNSSITFSLNYTFKAPKGINLPFLKKFKFDSNLTLGVNVTKSQDKSETAKQGLGFNTDSEKHNLNFNTTASYSFSNQISGGMKIGWTDTNDKKLKKVHHIRELSIWTEIRF
ncbi:MAG: hypothetical protein GY855_04750, partial [candidate division Zixibacteria bacterium]|nr:hypothetical protein [candidate division Zixibacteria bacterium]